MMFGDTRLPARFWAKAEQRGDGCWQWIGAIGGRGYGRIKWRGEAVPSYRLAYEALVGAVPEGLQLDHLCRNRACVNPAHLEPVTGAVNTLRGASFAAVNARKTHCKRGHEFTADNTYLWGHSRICRACRSGVGARRKLVTA